MVHPDTELRFINPVLGWGVFATRAIPRGTIIWALDVIDQRFERDEIAAMPEYARTLLDTYCYVDLHGSHILCWDHARFVNHSCDPTCLSVGYDFELAVRDIGAGEELTGDYGTLNPTEPFPCSCAAANCRKVVLPDDHVRLGAEWNRLAQEAFFLINTVSQPLWSILSERTEIENALADPTLLRPIQHHFPKGSPLPS